MNIALLVSASFILGMFTILYYVPFVEETTSEICVEICTERITVTTLYMLPVFFGVFTLPFYLFRSQEVDLRL